LNDHPSDSLSGTLHELGAKNAPAVKSPNPFAIFPTVIFPDVFPKNLRVPGASCWQATEFGCIFPMYFATTPGEGSDP
jgi:hypothetical protein